MLETLRCPSCSTRYGLRADRVKPGHRRARCFRCQSVFGIEAEVARLLGLPPAAELPAPVAAPVEEVDFLDFDAPSLGVEAPLQVEAPAAEEAEFDLGPVSFDEPELAPVLAAPAEAEAEVDLSLGDLGADDSLMEKTLVIDPPAPAEDMSAEFGGGYRSAKDAISKLLGELPAAEAPQPERRALARTGSGMDVEATLDALENTLGGGSSAPDLESTRPLHAAEVPEAPAPAAPDSGSTVRISQQDLMAALTRPESQPSPAGPRAPAPAPSPIPPPAPARPTMESTAAQDPGLLKLQVGSEVYQNLSTEQVTAWIDQGRVVETNLVARQFSENWIEAVKVPTLRPAFDRVRRQRSLPTELPPPPPAELPQKRSLFGGLFGRS